MKTYKSVMLEGELYIKLKSFQQGLKKKRSLSEIINRLLDSYMKQREIKQKRIGDIQQ